MEGALSGALPYFFTAFKIAATASVVGRDRRRGADRAFAEGLGRAILSSSTSSTSPAPEKLWATVLVSAALGIVFFAVVRLAELLAAPESAGG